MGFPGDTESNKPSVLGRGLGALLSNRPSTPSGPATLLSLTAIEPGRSQPRQTITPESLEELTASIKQYNVVQPILVRPLPGSPGRYEIIAGERRWRAAQLAGLTQIPAVVRELSDKDGVAVALIENIQREELTPAEEARALKRLLQEFKLTHDDVAHAVGRSRAAVTNLMRLLDLPDAVVKLLDSKALGMGHARAILGLPYDEDRERVAMAVVAQDLSVRQTEALVRQSQVGKKSSKATAAVAPIQDFFKNEAVHVHLQQKAPGRLRVTVDISDMHLKDSILEAIKLAASE